MKPHHKTFLTEKYEQVVMFYVSLQKIKSVTGQHVTVTVNYHSIT